MNASTRQDRRPNASHTPDGFLRTGSSVGIFFASIGQITLKATRVTLLPPQGSVYNKAVEVTAVMAQEINPPRSETPI